MVIRPNAIEQQGLTLTTGVSRETVGSNALCMRLMMLPPGTRGTPHSHKGHESAIWVAMGEAEIWHGPGLCGRTVVHAGDFLYIPPGTPHLPVNRSETKMMVAVMARTDPAERESVDLVRPSAAPGRAVRRPGRHRGLGAWPPVERHRRNAAATEKPRARIHDRGFSLG